MGSFFGDLSFGLRMLWKNKSFTLATVLTLGVCLGGNAAIFSVVNSVLLEPLPLPDSHGLVLMYNSYPKAGVERASNGVPDYYDRLRDLGEVFEEQALYQFPGLTIGEQGRAERISGMAVTPSFFRLLGIEPRLGRAFNEEEGEPGNEYKAIFSYGAWQRLFGEEEAVVGREVRLSGEPYTVVGVMPRGFFFLEPEVEVWIPLAFTAEEKSDEQRHSNSWENIGRLKPGATLEQVRARLDALTEANYERFPYFTQPLQNAGYHVQAHFLKDEVVRDIRGVLYLLWGGAVFVLLIGAANVTNLVLARSSVRLRELATRSFLGARRWQLSRQLLIEGILLSLISASLGLLIGRLGMDLLRPLGLTELPRGSEIELGAATVGFVLLLALLVGVLIGLIPVAGIWRIDLYQKLRQEGRTGTVTRRTRLLRNALVVGQIGFALVLLVGSGLMLASFQQVVSIDPGFRQASSVLTGSISLPRTRYPEPADWRSFFERALERVRALPGVSAAGVTTSIPLGSSFNDSVILAEGYEIPAGESLVSPSQSVVSPGYFEAMGIDLIEGRYFDRRDQRNSLPTIIIDQRLARKFWPGVSALGKRLYFPSSMEDLTRIDENTRFFTVVGVVRDVKLRALVDPDERVGAYYFTFEQTPRPRFDFAIKTATIPGHLTESIRREIAALDPELPFYDPVTMQQRLEESLVSRRSPTMLVGAFGALALFLAAVGIYGVLAYLVAQRTREVGIRIALGSSAGGIFRLILAEGLLIVGCGLLLGVAGSVGMARFVESLLYEVEPLNPFVLIGSAALLGAVGLLACSMPARRATRIDPVDALSAE